MDFEILIIGSDINAYYMARCTHEAYGKKAYMLAHSKMAFTHYSNIINIIYNDKIWDEKHFLKAINKFAKEFKKKKILLISSNETYAAFLVNNQLPENCVYNYPNKNILNSFINKEKFYKKYAKYDIDIPNTIYYACTSKSKPKIKGLTYPVIIKPADVVKYNHISFEGKNKIYKVHDENEALKVIDNIKNGGYDDTLIIQEFIPGDDSYLFDSVVYCNKNGIVTDMTFAQIGLQEHKKTMIGNAAILINGYNTYNIDVKPVIKKLKSFMEEIGYTGFAEFDLKYDYRDKKFKVLEINARQGRCSYYLSALGGNLVKILVDDVIFNKERKFKYYDDKVLLSFVPKCIAEKYLKNEQFKQEVLKLWNSRVNPVVYNKDQSLKRSILLWKVSRRYIQDYQNATWDNEVDK